MSDMMICDHASECGADDCPAFRPHKMDECGPVFCAPYHCGAVDDAVVKCVPVKPLERTYAVEEIERWLEWMQEEHGVRESLKWIRNEYNGLAAFTEREGKR